MNLEDAAAAAQSDPVALSWAAQFRARLARLHTKISTWFVAASLAIQQAWSMVPAEVQAYVAAHQKAAAGLWIITFFVARAFPQDSGSK